MTELDYRCGTSDDVAPAAALFIETMLDLCRRNGLPASAPDVADMVPWYAHLHAHGIFEVAYEGAQLIAFASGIVRDEHFFLSMFWTRPDRQRAGVGQPLLDRVWAAAVHRGARDFSVWSSIDFAALGIYLRRGMLPVGPILTFGGTARSIDASDTTLAPLDAASAGEFDRVVRGSARPTDHAFFAAQKEAAHLVVIEGRIIGYFYAHGERIGPAAWHEGNGRAVLSAAIATRPSRAVTLSIPGPNREAIDVAVEAGLHITGTSHYLSSATFGAIERYVPSGPALF